MATSQTIEVIEVAFSGGQGRDGVEFGPETLINHGLLNQLKGLGYNVQHNKSFKNIPKPENDPIVAGCKNSKYVSAANKSLFSAVKQACEVHKTTLVIGGDHSLAIGSIAGSAAVYPDICVIWVDAHADINTPDTSGSGNLHGCPLSFLLKLPSTEKVPELSWVPKCLSPDRLVYIGLRDVDEGERKILKEHKIKAFSMHDVDKYGIGRVVEMALDHVNPKRDLPIHMSYDVDALDPTVAPATGISNLFRNTCKRWFDFPRGSLYSRGYSRNREISCNGHHGSQSNFGNSKNRRTYRDCSLFFNSSGIW
eukprot:NODE_8_length_66115_cov_0.981823.p20 type:complete len:309 gc:universal NODE_8_length_66115_cov_0.981823:48905-49831(+)